MRGRASIAACVLAAGCGRFGFGTSSPHGDAMVPDSDALQPALVAYYTFDDDPSDGAADSSGFGHTAGCILSCPTLGPGHIGGAFAFNGTSDALRIANAPDLDPAGGLTVAGWVMFRTVRETSVAGKLYGAADLNTWQILVDSALVLQVCSTADPSTSRCDAGTTSPATGTWYHLAYVWTGAGHRLYVDGVKVVDQPVKDVFDTGDILLGVDINSGVPGTYLDGWLDELRIYNLPLQDAEIAALAAQ